MCYTDIIAMNYMKILLIEDDVKIGRVVRGILESQKFVVDVVQNARKGLRQALMIPYDGIILDLYLPEFTGDVIARSIRVHKKHVPILMLTAESMTDKKVELLGICDDYITKPFHMDELLARVRAVLRRGKVIHGEVLECADLSMDIKGCKVKRGLRTIELRNKEYTLLEYLLRHKGTIVSREEIIDHIWDAGANRSSFNLVDVHVRFLRQKIDTGYERPLIQTVTGRGYKIE